MQWWAYKHKNGEIKVKPYRNEEQMDEALDSDFVVDITGPFEAETVEQANEIAKKNLATSTEVKTIVFRRIRAMMRRGKTDKQIADILKAEVPQEEGPFEKKVMEMARAYGKELKKIIHQRLDADMKKVKEEFEIDSAITSAYDLYKRALKEELEYFV